MSRARREPRPQGWAYDRGVARPTSPWTGWLCGALAVVGCDALELTTPERLPVDAAVDAREVALADLPARYAAIVCARWFGCCDPAERMQRLGFADPPPTDEAACVAAYLPVAEAEIGGREPFDAGRMTYDAVAASVCLDALVAQGCAGGEDAVPAVCGQGRYYNESPAARMFFVGTVALGGTCRRNQECAGTDTYCAEALTGALSCAPLPQVGEPCTFGDCAAGAYCPTMMNPRCTADRVGEGQRCEHDAWCLSDNCVTPGVCAGPACDGA